MKETTSLALRLDASRARWLVLVTLIVTEGRLKERPDFYEADFTSTLTP